MNLFDPLRPLSSPGRASLLGQSCAAPGFYIFPELDETMAEVRVFLPMGRNDFSCHSASLALSQLPMLLANYRRDPEATLELYFGWKPLPMPFRSGSPPVTKPASAPSPIYDSQLDLI